MSQIDNILIQVRSLLQTRGIRLWLEPYYYEDIGSIESEIEKLAQEFSQELGINVNNCKLALCELQDGAISKLKARKEFENTGVATLKVKTVRPHGSSSFTVIKCPLSDTGKQFQQKLAEQVKTDYSKIKIISSGKVLQPEICLKDQNISNNQQLMALITIEPDKNDAAMNNRVRQAKEDAEFILKSKNQSFFRMEDQDGNAVYLPPNESKAITLALALYEKGRAAMKRDEFAEALILFLEADEKFSSCNSNILDSVDNYALLNLDIVWCYLCLKSFSQLPDAERRLKICEQNFQRSYGKNMDRVIALKGNSENERALIMRLHLLQGILLFHQNRRNEAYEKLIMAENELRSLQVDDESFLRLLEMGYGTAEARIALRSCNNDIEQAINFINERRQRKKEARERNDKNDKTKKKLMKFDGPDDNSEKWVNPKSLNTLISMGFEREMAFIALRMSKNDIQNAIDLLHNNQQQIMSEVHKCADVSDDLVQEIVNLGFDPEMARIALESAFNNSEQAIELLRQMQNDGNFTHLLNTLTGENNDQASTSSDQPGPSSGRKENILSDVKNRIKNEMKALKAYERFAEDMSTEDDEYLDLPLVQEENILHEYKRLLEQ